MARNMSGVPEKLRELKEKEFLEQKRRQRLRESSQELRELERQLKSAYFVKQLKEQQSQQEAQKKLIEQSKLDESLQIDEQRKRHEEYLRQQEMKDQQKKEEFRKVLEQQMNESLVKRQQGIEEMTRDRDHVEKLLQHLKIEQVNERREIEERQTRIRAELDNFCREQEEYKKRQKAIDEEERLRAEAIQLQRDEEIHKLEQLKRVERRQQATISEKLGIQLQKTELEKQRRENIMLELLEEERKTKEDYIFRKNLERQIRAREYVRLELERFIEQRKLEKEKARRNKLEAERAEIERLIAETEKAAALEMHQLREKETAYNIAIQKMLDERRQERATNLQAHLRDYELLRSEERKIQQEVEEERMRLLSQHNSEIFKYLPSGVLRDTDREFLALPPGKKK